MDAQKKPCTQPKLSPATVLAKRKVVSTARFTKRRRVEGAMDSQDANARDTTKDKPTTDGDIDLAGAAATAARSETLGALSEGHNAVVDTNSDCRDEQVSDGENETVSQLFDESPDDESSSSNIALTLLNGEHEKRRERAPVERISRPMQHSDGQQQCNPSASATSQPSRNDAHRARLMGVLGYEGPSPVYQPAPIYEPPRVYQQPEGEALFHQCYDADRGDVEHSDFPAGQGHCQSFHNFMDLPTELRDRIYVIVLRSDKPIAPHLCDADRPAYQGKADYGKAIRFHDDNQADHNATCKMLTITRVSRQTRAESLPIFYGANTFDTVADTPTYFNRLEQLDRFHMIRNVNFVVHFWNGVQYSQRLLRMLLQHFEEQKMFEMIHMAETGNKSSSETTSKTSFEKVADTALAPHERDVTKFYTDELEVLRNHPQHVMGGLEANFLVLRMLSTTFNDGDYNRKLVIHVPTPTLFHEYKSLFYFPSACEGLGIQLQLVSGRDVDMVGSGFRLSWAQKYQKKDFTDQTTAKDCDEVDALTRRVQLLFPDIEEVPRPAKRTYYRQKCKGGEIEWFSIDTVGGGILKPDQ